MYRLYDLRRVMSGSLNIDLFLQKPAANKKAFALSGWLMTLWLWGLCLRRLVTQCMREYGKPGAGGIVPTLNSAIANDWS